MKPSERPQLRKTAAYGARFVVGRFAAVIAVGVKPSPVRMSSIES